MPRVLIVDDDRFIQHALQRLLASEGFVCRTAATGAEMERVMLHESFDVLLLDVNLPDTDGFSLCRRLRTKYTMPVLYLTARSGSGEKVVGLEVGGDDYLTKPFDARELVARVRALLRRSEEYSRRQEETAHIRIGSLLIDAARRDAFRINSPLHLTDKEFALLYLLARNLDKALSNNRIFEEVWGFESQGGPGVVAVNVRRLRQKIEPDPQHPVFLLTVRGYGYQLTSAGNASAETVIKM